MAPSQDENRPSRRSKSADAFRTISEVSDDVGVPQHVLRFWETKFTQIKPLKRGGGRRYYRPEDIDLLNQIRAWLYDDGYTIKGVQKLLKEGGVPVSSAGRKPGSDTSRRARQADDSRAEEAGIDDSGADEADIAAEEEADSGKVRAATQQPAGGTVLRPSDQSAHSSPAARTDQVRAQDVKESRSAAIQSAASNRTAEDQAADGAGAEGHRAVYDREGQAGNDGADTSAEAASLDRAALSSAIENLEEIRDQLRGPPPEP